jgi:hypothetical protein
MDYIKQNLGPNKVSLSIHPGKYDETKYSKEAPVNEFEKMDDIIGRFRKEKTRETLHWTFQLYCLVENNMASLYHKPDDVSRFLENWKGELLKKTMYLKKDKEEVENNLKKGQFTLSVLSFIASQYKTNIIYENTECIDGNSESKVIEIVNNTVRETTMAHYYQRVIALYAADIDKMTIKDLKIAVKKLRVHIEKKSPLKNELKMAIQEKIEQYKG